MPRAFVRVKSSIGWPSAVLPKGARLSSRVTTATPGVEAGFDVQPIWLSSAIVARLIQARPRRSTNHLVDDGAETLIQPTYSRCLSTHHAQGANSQMPRALRARAFTLGGGEPLLMT